MRRLTTRIRSEKCVVQAISSLCGRQRVYLHEPRKYSLLHTQCIWYSLLLLGYKPAQHVIVLNTVGNCNTMVSIIILYYKIKVTAVEQWLRCCTTNRKVAGSIPAGVIGIFHCHKVLDTASNRNEYQEHFLAVKAAGA